MTKKEAIKRGYKREWDYLDKEGFDYKDKVKFIVFLCKEYHKTQFNYYNPKNDECHTLEFPQPPMRITEVIKDWLKYTPKERREIRKADAEYERRKAEGRAYYEND